MEFTIAKATSVCFEEGNMLEYPVMWDLHDGSIFAFPFSLPSPVRLVDYAENKTVGSFNWTGENYDIVRFDKDTLELSALYITVPRDPLEVTPAWSSWLSVAPLEGRLKLTQFVGFFAIEYGDYHSILLDPPHLILLNEDGLEDGSKTRIRIAHDFDALFLNGRLVGWLLSNPLSHVIHVVHREENPVEIPNDVELMSVLAELLELQTGDAFNSLILEHDGETYWRLVQLRRVLESHDVKSVPVSAMLARIEHLVDMQS